MSSLGQREILLLPTATCQEGTEKREPDSCQNCTVRGWVVMHTSWNTAIPSRCMGKLFMESLSLKLIQHLTGQPLQQPALLGLVLSRTLDSWRSFPEISSDPNYSMNLKIVLNLYQSRTISWCRYDFKSKIQNYYYFEQAQLHWGNVNWNSKLKKKNTTKTTKSSLEFNLVASNLQQIWGCSSIKKYHLPMPIRWKTPQSIGLFHAERQ